MKVKKMSSLIVLLLFFLNSRGQSCAAPELNPVITISYITATSAEGFITASSQPSDGYLVVRRTNANNDSSLWPVSGDTYIAGDLTLGGEIVNMETSITFSDAGLTDQTTYYYFIYPYNDCGDGFAYFTNVPGYPIETKAVPPCINEDFEGVQFSPKGSHNPNQCDNITIPDDWLIGSDNGIAKTCINDEGGYESAGSNYVVMDNADDFVVSPLVTNPTVLEFWARSESIAQEMAFITVQYSSDGLVWKSLPFYTATTGNNDLGDITTEWQRFILDFSMLNNGDGLINGDYKIKWKVNGTPFIFAMDNIKIYCDGSQTDCPPKASWTLNENNELGWWETDINGDLLPGDNPITPTSDISTTVKSDYDTATWGDFETCSLFIESGVTLNINSNSSTHHYVAVLKQLRVDGTLLIQDKNSLIMVYNDGEVINNGVINVVKKGQPTKKYDYTYWSSPVEGAPLSTFSPSDQSYIFKYVTQNFLDLYDNNTGGGTSGEPDGLDDDEPYLSDWSWNPDYDWQIPTTPMIPGVGYIVQAPAGGSSTGQEVTFNGVVNNGIVKSEVYLSSNPQSLDQAVYPFDFDDWNLIGNPYPSAIDAAAFLGNPSNIDLIGGTAYLWTHTEAISVSNIGYGGYDNFSRGDYAYYNRAGEVLAFPNQGPDLLGKIASGQSFMVEVNGTGSEGTKVGEVTFINSMRFGEKESDTRTYPANDNSVFYKHGKNKKVSKTNNDDKIWLNMTENSGAFSQMLVGFFEYSQSNSEHATDGIDRAYDAFKLFSGNYIDFYSIVDDKPFAIQGREPLRNDDIIPIGFKSNIYGTLKISIDHIAGDLSGREILLEDKLVHVDGEYHNLSKSDYEFSVIEPGVFDNRFNMRFTFDEQELESENIDNKEVLIYNSKFNEDIFIESLNGTKIKRVVVYDLLGRVINNTEFNGAGYVLRAPNFNKGTVLIFKIILDNGKMHNIKFIKL